MVCYLRSVASRFRVLLCCSFSFALVLCVFCRDAVVGCGGLLRSVCCRLLVNVIVGVDAVKCAVHSAVKESPRERISVAY